LKNHIPSTLHQLQTGFFRQEAISMSEEAPPEAPKDEKKKTRLHADPYVLVE